MKPSSIASAVRTLFDADMRPMIWGPPGVGKTELLKSLQPEYGEMIICHGLTHDAVDVHGFPKVVEDADGNLITLFSRPGFWPKHPKGILFLDEFCFPENTRVSVMEGDVVVEKPIQDIKRGDKVVSHCLNESRSRANIVDEVTIRYASGLVELTTKNGKKIRATPNHRFFTQHGWKQIAEIQKGDRIYRVPAMRAEGRGDQLHAFENARRDHSGVSGEVSGLSHATSSHAGGGVGEYVEDPEVVGIHESRVYEGFAGSSTQNLECFKSGAAGAEAAGSAQGVGEILASATQGLGSERQQGSKGEVSRSVSQGREGGRTSAAHAGSAEESISEMEEILVGAQAIARGIEREESRNGSERTDSFADAPHSANGFGAPFDRIHEEAPASTYLRGGRDITSADSGREAPLEESGLHLAGREDGGAIGLVLDEGSTRGERGLRESWLEDSPGQRSGDERRDVAFDETVGLYFDEAESVVEVEFDGPVYDLTVANDHNFFAEGMLTHNCSAPGLVMSAFSQLLLNRRIGEHVLPPGWHIVLASNRMSDRAIVHQLPSNIANRVIHIDFEVSLDDWTTVSLAQKKRAEVIAYCRFAPNDLHDFDPSGKKSKDKSSEHAFPSPRSWWFVSDILDKNPPQDIETDLIIGAVGKGAGSQFISFLRMYRDAPSLDAILLEPKKSPIPEKLNVRYAVAIGLSRRMDSKNARAVITYLNRYKETDIGVMSVKMAVERDADIAKTKEFMEWSVSKRDDLFSIGDAK